MSCPPFSSVHVELFSLAVIRLFSFVLLLWFLLHLSCPLKRFHWLFFFVCLFFGCCGLISYVSAVVHLPMSCFCIYLPRGYTFVPVWLGAVFALIYALLFPALELLNVVELLFRYSSSSSRVAATLACLPFSCFSAV